MTVLVYSFKTTSGQFVEEYLIGDEPKEEDFEETANEYDRGFYTTKNIKNKRETGIEASELEQLDETREEYFENASKQDNERKQ